MVEFFYFTLVGFLGAFQKSPLNSNSEENILAPASVKRNSTAYEFSRVLKAGKTKGCSLQACNLQQRNSIRWWKTFLRILIRSSFLVELLPVGCKPKTSFKRKFLEIFRGASFRNILIHVIKLLAELQNVEISSVTLLKSNSSTGAHISKISNNFKNFIGTLRGFVCDGVHFE